jgi:hypothetical protein
MAKIARLEKHLGAGHTGLVLFDALNGSLHLSPRSRSSSPSATSSPISNACFQALGAPG